MSRERKRGREERRGKNSGIKGERRQRKRAAWYQRGNSAGKMLVKRESEMERKRERAGLPG